MSDLSDIYKCVYIYICVCVCVRHGVNSIPELLGNFGIAYLKNNWIGINKFGIEVSYKKNKIHKLIYCLIFLFRSISSMTILL